MSRRRTSTVFPIAIGIGAVSIGALAVYSHFRGGDAQPVGSDAAPAAAPDVPPETVFEVDLPAFVIAVDDWAKSGDDKREALDSAREQLVGRAAVPPPVKKALGEAADAAIAAATAASASTDRAADILSKRVDELNRALTAADLDYWVDSSVLSDDDQRVVLLFSFVVDGVSDYTSGGERLRVRRVHRLDQLNWKYTMFGFTATARKDTVVMVDTIDERLLTELLPALTDGAGPRTATAVIRSDFPAAVGRSLDGLIAPIARRAELFAAIADKFTARGLELPPPATLTLAPGWKDELKSSATEAQLRELEAIERTLSSDESRDALLAAREPIARSVELHELQHRLDLSADLPMPKSLEAIAGPLRDEHGKPRALAEHALAELSAYLGELARSPVPRIALVQLAEFAMDETMLGRPESYAAVVILDELARELKLSTPAIVVDHKLVQDAVRKRFAALAERSPDELSRAAKAIWPRLFSIELQPLQPAGKQAAPNR